MIVDTRELADFPADGHALEEIIFENEIASVAALGEEKIFFEGVGADVILDDEVLHVREREIFGGDGGEIFDPVGDGELRGRYFIKHQKPPTDYSAAKEATKRKKGYPREGELKDRDGIAGEIAGRVAGMAGGDWGAGVPRGSDLSGAVSREEF
jgi:hypothetical protein